MGRDSFGLGLFLCMAMGFISLVMLFILCSTGHANYIFLSN